MVYSLQLFTGFVIRLLSEKFNCVLQFHKEFTFAFQNKHIYVDVL
jgi:hypothetical protein